MGTVLILSATPSLLLPVVERLSYESHQVIKKSSGYEGLIALEAQHYLPDLILTDTRMPVMDGWEFLAHIRNNTRWSHLPCCIMSGSEHDQEWAGYYNFFWVPKPTHFYHVEPLIRRFCRGSGARNGKHN